jgi:transaldolase/glucose-6-phosphate isomerase
MERLKRLLEFGQSYWLDNLTRTMLDNGELARRVEGEGLRGMTSNPKTFSAAISRGEGYDGEFRELVRERLPVQAIYERLAISDVRRACDLFRTVYDDTKGADGFVSLEVSPYLAHDAEGTVEEARRLYRAVERPNVFIKIPGTLAGLDAIEQMIYEGVNINVTLLFAVERYEAVADRYLRALERRRREKLSVDSVASVASFFLSRIDVLADRLLGQRMRLDGAEQYPNPGTLLGKLAVANAKLAYRSFRRITGGERWRALEGAGARVQRVLWASTSTKNPLYDDVMYVDPLIGPDTVNTMPARTIAAFADHGTPRPLTIEEDVEASLEVFAAFRSLGLDPEAITGQLENEGVEKFRDPFDELMKTLAEKRRALLEAPVQTTVSGKMEQAFVAGLEALDEMSFGRRLFARDAYLWTRTPSEVRAIRGRLGWLEPIDTLRRKTGEIREFAEEVRERFDRALVLGMGGSSLTASVGREIFGGRQGAPELLVLDSTHPEAVAEIERWVKSARTLFLVASKSGTTTETMAFYRFFYDLVRRERGESAGREFAAITDAGTPLAEEGRKRAFRKIFESPQDVGGRYSALTAFGLVPLAILGVDIDALLSRAIEQEIASGGSVPAAENPAIALGALLGLAARDGRDKVTFVPGSRVDPFSRWAEQLLAESTGKDGRGLIPVVDEPLGSVDAYSADRIFVCYATPYDPEDGRTARLRALEEAGHPVVRIEVGDPLDLGGEFLRFELATAVAGAILGVNPFDEPNVAESKENTRRLLDDRGAAEPDDRATILFRSKHVSVHADSKHDWARNVERSSSLSVFLAGFLSQAEPGDYLSLLSYLPWSTERHQRIQSLRTVLRDRLQLATTLGYGPRYLHSTGQLHKGGPDRGLFLVLTADAREDRSVPGMEYGFRKLLAAQMRGDIVLQARGRRVVRVHLGDDIDVGLSELIAAVVEPARAATTGPR